MKHCPLPAIAYRLHLHSPVAIVRLACLLALLGAAGAWPAPIVQAASPQVAAPDALWPLLSLSPAVSGLNAPVTISNAGDGSGRLFVLEQGGRIRIVKGSAVLSTPFLDLSTKISTGGERGLLGLAFPPGYASKGHFYVYYTAPDGTLTVARYGLTANQDVANPASEQIVLTQSHPAVNHNGGQLAFGPADGFLYIGMGDGGGAGDQPGNAQNLNTWLGKILRIDVESGAPTYTIPAGNPFFGQTNRRGEIWAYGLRNPWRFSFDRKTRDLYIADVGQNAYEEVDFQAAASAGGENYGWNIMEGFHCYNAATCNQAGLTLPVAEYDHASGGCSITGGYIYRGGSQRALAGVYLYGDYCSGKIWGLQRVGGGWQSKLLLDTTYSITTFGEDEAGEVYLANAATGTLYRVSAGPRMYLPLIMRQG